MGRRSKKARYTRMFVDVRRALESAQRRAEATFARRGERIVADTEEEYVAALRADQVAMELAGEGAAYTRSLEALVDAESERGGKYPDGKIWRVLNEILSENYHKYKDAPDAMEQGYAKGFLGAIAAIQDAEDAVGMPSPWRSTFNG